MSQSINGTIDSRTFAIGVLTVTACVLFVGFLLVSTQPAQATGQSDRSGDYKILTMQVTRSNEQVVIVDAAAKRAILYEFNYAAKQLNIAAIIPFENLAKPSATDTGNGSRPPGRRR